MDEEKRLARGEGPQYIVEEVKPLGKRGACCVVYNGKLYMFGGFSGSDYLGGGLVADRNIAVFDFTEYKWSQARTRGVFPKVITGACATLISDCMYLFGGWYRGLRNCDVYQLNLETMTWRKLTVKGMKGGPMCKDKAGMVDYGEEMLCVMAGYGYPLEDFVKQPGASYDWDTEFVRELCWTNELHLFHTKSCAWISPEVTGPRPPPCGAFSFTRVDSHRVVLFGGRQREERTDQLHLLDMDTWHWSGMILPSSPESPWPSKRSFHMACPLLDPDSSFFSSPTSPCPVVGAGRRHTWLPCPPPDLHVLKEEERCGWGGVDQKLLILWGMDNNSDPVSEAWILNISTLTWTQVSLPADRVGVSRIWHCGAAYHPTPHSAIVLAVGGTHHNLFKNQEEQIENLQDTTLLSFGVRESLFSLCVKLISENLEDFQVLLQHLPRPIQDAVQRTQSAATNRDTFLAYDASSMA